MAHLIWVDATGVNPTNLNKMAQNVDLQPDATVAFAGSAGRTITHDYGHTDYMVHIDPVAQTNGYLGDVWISKASNTARGLQQRRRGHEFRLRDYAARIIAQEV